jgi:uncharacterized protein (DUF305 family)
MNILNNKLALGLIVAGTVLGGTAPVIAADAMQAYMQSMDVMNKDMKGAPMTGDADHDFAAMMRPHHLGAIAMAKVELQYGKDKTLRSMAKAIIASQHKEVGAFDSWLAKHPAKKAMSPNKM